MKHRALADRTELLAEARQLVRIAPDDGVARYLLGLELMAHGERDEGRRELVEAVALMTPAEAARFGAQAARTLVAAGFHRDAGEIAATIVVKRRPR